LMLLALRENQSSLEVKLNVNFEINIHCFYSFRLYVLCLI
jgi:hypothetical protein